MPKTLISSRLPLNIYLKIYLLLRQKGSFEVKWHTIKRKLCLSYEVVLIKMSERRIKITKAMKCGEFSKRN